MSKDRTQVILEELLLVCLLVVPCFAVDCPSFVDHPTDTSITLSSANNYRSGLFLFCETSSLDHNDQYIAWLKDGVQISDENYNIITNVYAVPIGNRYDLLDVAGNHNRFGLFIDNITPCTAEFDSGNYSCMLMSKSTNCSVSTDPGQVTISVDGLPANHQCTVYITTNSIPTIERMTSISNIVSSSVHTTSLHSGNSQSVHGVSFASMQATDIRPGHSLVQTNHADSASTTVQRINVDSRLLATTMPTQTTSPSDLTTIRAGPSFHSNLKVPCHESVFKHPAFVAVSVSGAMALLVAITLFMIIIVYRCRGKENKERVGNEIEMSVSADEQYAKEESTHVLSNKIELASEDEHYQSLGKQSESLYAGLTTDNKI